MDLKDLLELFKDWGERNSENIVDQAAIKLYDDGSGSILDLDDNTLFTFGDVSELIVHLEDT